MRVTWILVAGVVLGTAIPIAGTCRAALAPDQVLSLANGRPQAAVSGEEQKDFERRISEKDHDIAAAAARCDSNRVKTLVRQRDALVRRKFEIDSTLANQHERRPLHWLPSFGTGIRLAGEGNLPGRVLTSGELLYEIPFEANTDFHLAVTGNFGAAIAPQGDSAAALRSQAIDALRSSKEGIKLTLWPYWILYERSGNLAFVPHLMLSLRSNEVTFPDSTQGELSQFESGLGVSIGIGKTSGTDARPLMLGLRGSMSLVSGTKFERLFGTRKNVIWNGRWSLVVPVSSSGAAVGLEAVFTDDFAPAWQASMLFTKRSDSKKSP